MHSARKTSIRLGLLAGMLALAGCAEDGASTTGAQPAASPATNAQAAAPAANSETRINMPDCVPAANGKVAFKVGGAVLRVPGQVIEYAVPSSITGPVKREAVLNEVQARVAKGEGCPATPLDSRVLLVRDNLNHPLLNGNVSFLRTENNNITSQFAKLTTQLRDNPEGRCRAEEKGLLACPGTETQEGRKTEVLYLISTDRAARMSSGGPLFARCLLAEKSIRGCVMFDRLTDGTTFDATLASGEYTTESLKSAQRAVLTKIAEWRG